MMNATVLQDYPLSMQAFIGQKNFDRLWKAINAAFQLTWKDRKAPSQILMRNNMRRCIRNHFVNKTRCNSILVNDVVISTREKYESILFNYAPMADRQAMISAFDLDFCMVRANDASGEHEPHWFDSADAVAPAPAPIKAKIAPNSFLLAMPAALRKKREALARRRALLAANSKAPVVTVVSVTQTLRTLVAAGRGRTSLAQAVKKIMKPPRPARAPLIITPNDFILAIEEKVLDIARLHTTRRIARNIMHGVVSHQVYPMFSTGVEDLRFYVDTADEYLVRMLLDAVPSLRGSSTRLDGLLCESLRDIIDSKKILSFAGWDNDTLPLVPPTPVGGGGSGSSLLFGVSAAMNLPPGCAAGVSHQFNEYDMSELVVAMGSDGRRFWQPSGAPEQVSRCLFTAGDEEKVLITSILEKYDLELLNAYRIQEEGQLRKFNANKVVYDDEILGGFHSCGESSNFSLTIDANGKIEYGLPPHGCPQDKMTNAGLDPSFCNAKGDMYGRGFYVAKEPTFPMQSYYSTVPAYPYPDNGVCRQFIAFGLPKSMVDIMPLGGAEPPAGDSYRALLNPTHRDYHTYHQAVYVYPPKSAYSQVYFPYIIDICAKGYVPSPTKKN